MQTANPQHQQEVIQTGTWNDVVPLLVEDDVINELEKTRIALRQAQKMVRTQERRINVLEKLALTDELTGLTNRRGFDLAFCRELSLIQREPTACGIVVMIDLDGFKSINDQWGHHAGDEYLRAVATTLKKHVRASDIVARLGGDEFAVLMTHVGEANAISCAVKLEQIFNTSFMTARVGDSIERFALRASFGLATYSPTDSVEHVMELADLRLYAHKARNKGAVAS